MCGYENEKGVFAGADEFTPSRSEYFSWINNTNEGATENQTLINLSFFRWLHEYYGMILDIYAFDAGALDGPGNMYGRLDSPKFKRQFPNGFEPIAVRAKEHGCRLGIWGGPDGFGNSEEEAQARIELMAGLCKPPLNFELFKFDGVCGTLRPEKANYFVKMMQECRKYAPNLILLNHRLELYDGLPYATTFLMGGMETYIDVSYCNAETCIHHRQGSLARDLPKLPPSSEHPEGRLTRMTEDHGVCISTFPDAWDDDLILQSFNRGLILAPEIYGNPWFLRDDEYPKLARIFNLFRRYRDILVHGFELPPGYGLYPMSRGDDRRRFLTLRNNSWDPIVIPVKLDRAIGLGRDVEKVVVRRAHPHEYWYGEFITGETLDIEVPPFHSLLLLVFDARILPFPEITIKGCDFDILRDIDRVPVEINLLGMLGTNAVVELNPGNRKFSKATIDGEILATWTGNMENQKAEITFPGTILNEKWHKKVATLQEVELPSDVTALYENVAFTADNSCLEVRCRRRFGETMIPEVQACRDAFFNQPIFLARGCWDKYAFDGDDGTIWHLDGDLLNCLRIDFGKPLYIDKIKLIASGQLMEEEIVAHASLDLKTWHILTSLKGGDHQKSRELPSAPDMSKKFPRNLDERFAGERRVPAPPQPPKIVEFEIHERPVRYFRMKGTPDDVFEINIMVNGKWLTPEQKSGWHGTFLFEDSQELGFEIAWTSTITMLEIPSGAKLCVACEGKHGVEGVYAVLRVGGEIIAPPERAPAYLGKPWEHLIANSDSNYTYYFPLKQEWIGKSIEITCFATEYYEGDCHPVAWMTVWPDPMVIKKLILE